MIAVAVIDTSVYVADALSRRQTGSPSRVLDLALNDDFHLVLSTEILAELIGARGRHTWSEARVMEYFGPVFDSAIWLKPVPHEPHHLSAVQGHSPDTIVVRTAEAIYVSNRPDLVAIPAKYVVSMNTKHFPPGAAYAGFMFVTPHQLLER